MIISTFKNSFKWIFAVLFFCIAAQAAPGDLDASFNGTGKVRVPIGASGEGAQSEQGVVRQSDGKIVVASSCQDVLTNAGFCTVRYNTNGSIDTSFGTNGKVLTPVGSGGSLGTTAAIQADGKILVGGYANLPSGYYGFGIVRYNANGTLDTTFGSGGIVVVDLGYNACLNALTVQSDGKIVAAGYAYSFAVVRLNSNGLLDTTFDGDGIALTAASMGGINLAVAMQGTKIVTAGYAGNNAVLIRYNANGTLDATFGSGGIVVTTNGAGTIIAYSLTFAGAYAGEDKIIVTGAVKATAKATQYIAIWSYNQSNGTPDLTFGTSGGRVTTSLPGIGYSIKTQFSYGVADKIVVAGAGGGAGGNFIVLRYTLTGAPDTTFGSGGAAYADIYDGSSDVAYAMFIQPADNKIVASGLSYIGGDSDFSIARFNTNGSLDTTFDGDGKRADDIGNGGAATIKAVAVQTDGRIVAAGGSSIARFNPDGSIDNQSSRQD